MNKKVIKKYILIVLAIALVIGVYYQNKQIKELQEGIRTAEHKILDYISYNSIKYLGEKIQNNPSHENLMSLGMEMTNQQRNFDILMDVNRFRMKEDVWQKYLRREFNQSTAFVAGLSQRDEISQQEFDKLRDIIMAWEKFQLRISRMSLGFITDQNIEEAVDAYVDLFAGLSAIAPNP